MIARTRRARSPVSPKRERVLRDREKRARTVNGNAAQVLHPSPWHSTTYGHANYPKEFAGVRSLRVSKG
jgi:hypothetical protein